MSRRKPMSDWLFHDDHVTDGKVTLGPFRERHCDRRYLRWFKNPMVKKFIRRRPKTLAAARCYVSGWLRDRHCRFFSIYFRGLRVGTLKLEKSNVDPRVWWLGLMVGDGTVQGQGVGPRAIWLACCYAFDRLEAQEILAGISRDNHASIKAFLKAGFAYRDFPGRPADVLVWKRR